ncbi:class I SAM-dependent methyltransferase [Spirillospora sp. NPDC047418]
MKTDLLLQEALVPSPYPVLYRIGLTPWERITDEGPLPSLLAERAPGRALDAGCGAGRHAVKLARSGWTVTGVDGVGRPLRVARARAAAAGVEGRTSFVKADVTRLEQTVHGMFDLVLDIGCLHGLSHPRQRRFADFVTSHTREGAALVIHAVMPRTGLGPKGLDEDGVSRIFPEPWSLVGTTDSPISGGGPLRGAAFRWYRLHR